MKTITLAVIISLGVAGLAGCASHEKKNAVVSEAPAAKTPAGTNVFSDEKARISYAIGMTLGHNFEAQGVEVDPGELAHGVKDMMAGGTTLMTPDQMHEILAEFQKEMAAKQKKLHDEIAAKNLRRRSGISGDEQKQSRRRRLAGWPAIHCHHQRQRSDARNPMTS